MGIEFGLSKWLNHHRVILASSSPRRKEILGRLGIIFEVIPSTFPETLDKSKFPDPSSYVMTNAHEKANEVATRIKILTLKDTHCYWIASVMSCHVMSRPVAYKDDQAIIIASDTIVVVDNKILEKPIDAKDAQQMLRQLENREHAVLTAVVIKQFIEKTLVKFTAISQDLMDAYIASGEPFDKAGGYGYQSLAAIFIEKIDGCYYNCIGFPLNRFVREIDQFKLLSN
eukprot:jgi/Hompol1/4764/HPOL_003862-RA